MIVTVEKIGKKSSIAGKLAKRIKKVLLGERYPVKEIEDFFVNAENDKVPGAITQASVNALLKPVKNPYETTQEEPATWSDEKMKYATIRRTYSVKYKYRYRFD
jgi:hypothetical protein